jgi:hypothetical protein
MRCAPYFDAYCLLSTELVSPGCNTLCRSLDVTPKLQRPHRRCSSSCSTWFSHSFSSSNRHVPRRSSRALCLAHPILLPPNRLRSQAFRAAFDARVLASVCFFATDIHSATLGAGDDSLARVRAGDLSRKGEMVVSCLLRWAFGHQLMRLCLQMIFGKQDTHVPRAGRDLIRKTLDDAGVQVSVCHPVGARCTRCVSVDELCASQFLEVQAQHAFIRDESSKGRWDAALTRSLFSFMMEVFERTVGRDMGPRVPQNGELAHVC